ncbi:MAG: hypothetical protein ACP5IX_00475 [Patescibacteria group bacterium]
MPEMHKIDNPYLQTGWDLLLQRDLIKESGMDKFEWIERYSPLFRQLVEEKADEIKELIKDPELLKETFKKWLYEDKEETIH